MRTLVLNSGFEPLHLVSWQKAICLVLIGKAEVVAEYDEFINTVSDTFALPSIVRLKRYVRVVQHITRVRCTRRNILMRDGYKCQYCGINLTQKTGTVDHIRPRSKGGLMEWKNVVASCGTCNRKKGSRMLKQIGLKLLSEPRRPTWFEILKCGKEPVVSEWLDFLGLNQKRKD